MTTGMIEAMFDWPSVRSYDLCLLACSGLEMCLTPRQLLASLGPAELSFANLTDDAIYFLRARALALVSPAANKQQIARLIAPVNFSRYGLTQPDWNSPAHCDRCGPVFLWALIHVSGCPWCFNRIHQLPIPRPAAAAKPKKGGQRANAPIPANGQKSISAHRRTPTPKE